jgi:aminopeptidase-like protein
MDLKNFLEIEKKLWPLNRSLTGKGVNQTLKILKNYNNKLKVINFKSGKKVFDWTIPKVWVVNEAWIKNDFGEKIIDFKKNNLHLLGYSAPIKKKLYLKQFIKKLHFHKKQPNAIPYVTSYYKKNWGFCLTYNQFKKMSTKKKYEVFINSRLKKGNLNCAEIYIPGKSKKEILFSTYICHPSMANNELSGPILSIFLSKWIGSFKNRKWSYRFIFVPETIGSIAYLSKNFKKLKKNVIAGYVLTCLGDERSYSFLPSKFKNSISDKIARKVLIKNNKSFKEYSWLDSRSDEIQFCSPGIDLPIASLMRTKYGEYPEYHTSLDTFGRVVTYKGLNGSLNLLKKLVNEFEKSVFPIAKYKCEPQLGKRGLYPSLSKKNTIKLDTRLIQYFLSYSDGQNSLLDIAKKCNVSLVKILKIEKILKKKKLIAYLQ